MDVAALCRNGRLSIVLGSGSSPWKEANMTGPEILFPLVAILLLGLAKGGFGGVGAPVALPVMSLGLPVEVAIGVLLPVLLTIDVVNVINHRRRADYLTVAILLPGALIGVGLGALMIDVVPGRIVGACVGIIAIVFAVQSLFFAPKPGAGLSRWLALPFGAASGLTSSIAHAGGPPIHIYLLSRGYDQLRFVATSNMVMASVNVLKIAPFFAVGALNAESLRIAAWLLPAAALAAGLGYVVAKVLPKSVFKYAVNGLMIAAGVKLILDAVP